MGSLREKGCCERQHVPIILEIQFKSIKTQLTLLLLPAIASACLYFCNGISYDPFSLQYSGDFDLKQNEQHSFSIEYRLNPVRNENHSLLMNSTLSV